MKSYPACQLCLVPAILLHPHHLILSSTSPELIRALPSLQCSHSSTPHLSRIKLTANIYIKLICIQQHNKQDYLQWDYASHVRLQRRPSTSIMENIFREISVWHITFTTSVTRGISPCSCCKEFLKSVNCLTVNFHKYNSLLYCHSYFHWKHCYVCI